jgi:hypothetical protein
LRSLFDARPMDVAGFRETFVELSRLKKKLRTYASKPKERAVRTYKSFKVNLDGWKYLPKDKGEAFLFKARLAQSGLTEIRAMMVFGGSAGGRDWQGYWDDAKQVLALTAPNVGAQVDAVRDAVEALRNTLDHELAHVGQTLIQYGKGLKEEGGLPSKDIRDLRYSPTGRPVSPQRKERQQVDHALHDVEFYTNLRSDVGELRYRLPTVAEHKREERFQRFIDEHSGLKLMKEQAPRKWAKYVSELRKAVEEWL